MVEFVVEPSFWPESCLLIDNTTQIPPDFGAQIVSGFCLENKRFLFLYAGSEKTTLRDLQPRREAGQCLAEPQGKLTPYFSTNSSLGIPEFISGLFRSLDPSAGHGEISDIGNLTRQRQGIRG